MTKPTELNQQMLNYLMAMSREEQERIPPTRAGLIAWLGTEAGVEWLRASPVGGEIVTRTMAEHVGLLDCMRDANAVKEDTNAANVE